MLYDKDSYIWKTIGLGAVAGMRAMSAPALLSNELSKIPTTRLSHSPLHYLQSGAVSTGLKVMAASEMLGDKIPGIPDRITIPSVLTRAASGALVGATLFTANKDKTMTGAAVGAAAAVAATYISFYLRKLVRKQTSFPDAFSGVIEDAIMLGSGLAITKS
ncbi:DUF4126 family protein [Pontibacter sp. MBLB2868]|uniref:DUF4126 family protein n=1 Tax=Pontibacter sp. MBLB2868 TaxID=3451555 RepID=UPI003F756184